MRSCEKSEWASRSLLRRVLIVLRICGSRKPSRDREGRDTDFFHGV